MKKCPFCAEEIQDEAVKCRYCGEFLKKEPKVPWYFSRTFLTLAAMCVGPLILPLIVIHPTMKVWKKIVICAILILVTIYFFEVLSNIQQTLDQFGQMDLSI